MSKICVTGAGDTGYLGRHVASFLGADALSRENGYDLTDPTVMDNIASKYDTIIHMAAAVDKSEKDPERVFRTNADATRDLASRLGADKTLIFASTKEVHTAFENRGSYDHSKAMAEHAIDFYANHNGFGAGIFRLSTTYGLPRPNGRGSFVNFFVDSVKNGKQLDLQMEGEQWRDFLHVDDLTRAFKAFLDSDIQRGTYDVGGGPQNSATMLDFVNRIGEVVGKTPVVGWNEAPVKGQVHYITDLRHIRQELGWGPLISIEEGIKLIS